MEANTQWLVVIYLWLLHSQRNLSNQQNWKWIWKTSAPAKVQFLLWLIAHEALPTNDLRHKRGLASSSSCQRCSCSVEDILHVLRDCPHAREVWYSSGMTFASSFFTHQSPAQWVLENIQSDMECLFLAGVWWLWCWRNQTVMGDDDWEVRQAISEVLLSAHDYARFINPRKSLDAAGLPVYKWKRPPAGVLKLNVDGSCKLTSSAMFTGGLIRSDQGEWQSGFTSREGVGVGDSLLAELLAIKNGLVHAWNKGARNIICESDSAEAISLVQLEGDYSFLVYGALLHDIAQAANRPWRVQFMHIMREANNCADLLAKAGYQVQADWKDWLEPPVQLVSLLHCDILMDPP